MPRAATGPVPPSPKTSQAQIAPAATIRVLTFVRLLIGRGQQLVAAMQRCAEDPAMVEFAWLRFCSRNIPKILARLAYGLQLAAALEARLLWRASRGLDMPKRRVRPRTQKSGLPVSSAKPAPQKRVSDDAIPTARQIAAMVRRRGAGAVIVEICRAFALGPGQLTSEQRKDLLEIVETYGGTYSDLIQFFMHRSHITREEWVEAFEGRLPRSFKMTYADPVLVLPDSAQAPCTGPPLHALAA